MSGPARRPGSCPGARQARGAAEALDAPWAGDHPGSGVARRRLAGAIGARRACRWLSGQDGPGRCAAVLRRGSRFSSRSCRSPSRQRRSTCRRSGSRPNTRWPARPTPTLPVGQPTPRVRPAQPWDLGVLARWWHLEAKPGLAPTRPDRGPVLRRRAVTDGPGDRPRPRRRSQRHLPSKLGGHGPQADRPPGPRVSVCLSADRAADRAVRVSASTRAAG